MRGKLRKLALDDASELAVHSFERRAEQVSDELARHLKYQLLRDELEGIAARARSDNWDSEGSRAVPIEAISFCYRIFEQCERAHEPVGTVSAGDGCILWEIPSDDRDRIQKIEVYSDRIEWASFEKLRPVTHGFVVVVDINPPHACFGYD